MCKPALISKLLAGLAGGTVARAAPTGAAWSPYTLSSSSTNMASGIYTFLLLDNHQNGGDPANAFLVQYVRVWRLDPSSGSGGARAKEVARQQ